MNAIGQRRRTVAARIVLSYVVVLLLFAGASTWSVVAHRQAVAEAAQLRQGYLPLALSLRDLVSAQDSWNSQLNHVTTAKNPADARAWFETATTAGRPRKVAEVRRALARALPSASGSVSERELAQELGQVETMMSQDPPMVRALFAALARGAQQEAETVRDALVRHGIRVQRSLTGLEDRATSHVDGLVLLARSRERTALVVLVVLTGLTLLVGSLMAVYASRVLEPLSKVTKRAAAVAAGDLSVQPAIDSGDEIGELSQTFESMVRAIAEAREKLLASERLAAIGKMAAHVTHEVRNPLSSIALNLDLLEEELQPTQQEATNLVRAIGQEVARLSRLSDQYLSMSKRKAPEVEDTDLGTLLREAVSFMERELLRQGVAISLQVAPDLPWLVVDQGQIRQTIFNLVRNAREAMPEGGRVTIGAFCRGQEVWVEVRDTGPGVPAERVPELFDPFFTTKDHGTGLGLAVTKQILVAHGGRLEYRPAVPRGSVFVLILPVGSDEPLSTTPGGSDWGDVSPSAVEAAAARKESQSQS